MSGGNDNPTDDQPVIVLPGSLPKRRPLTVGRSPSCDVVLDDGGVSREHLELAYDGAAWTFRCLGANNGSYLDGVRIDGATETSSPRCLRLGRDTLLTPVADIAPYLERELRVDGGLVIGPLVGAAYATIAEAAAAGLPVLIRGETGTGKADAAAHYARSCGRQIVPINVALATSAIAPSTLFGSKKGAFSGADADREGWFGAAHGKVLFLDELGELPLEVQAMLLHAVETGEILPVGANAPRKVDVHVVAATNVDLEGSVAAGKFRSDLLARLEKRSIVLSPLRERRADVPWMIHTMIAAHAVKRRKAALPITAGLAEACMLHPWPRNARQLDTAVGRALEIAWTAGAEAVGLGHCEELREASGGHGEEAPKRAALREAYERLGSVRKAAEEVGIAKSTAGEWLKKK